MVTKPEFYELVLNAYQLLYDFAQLRKHDLTDYVLTDTRISHKERGWHMHNMLLETIEELHPGHSAPLSSREWRRYRLLVLRYIDVLQPNAVANELAISRRQFYREHQAAMEAMTDIFWDRYMLQQAEAESDEQPDESIEHIEAIRTELSRIASHDVQKSLQDVLARVLQTLSNFLEEKAVVVEMQISDDIMMTSVEANLIRQVLLGLLGVLLDETPENTLELVAQADNSRINITIATAIPLSVNPDALDNQVNALNELLAFNKGQFNINLVNEDQIESIDLSLPISYEHKILVVDDNRDTLALYKRFLTPNRYQVITTDTPQSVLRLAQEIGPDIIVLDLMMPELDGWEILQQLSNNADTSQIPIMICSVIKQSQLALAMGAKAFLEKPFTEQSLLETLQKLKDGVQ